MKKLLLIDDDIALRTQFSFILKNDYEVYEASNYIEAFDIIKNIKLDIALVDLGLPPSINSNEEGKKVINALKELKNVKIIVLTGQESKEYAKELLGMGVFDYLLKPLDIPTLISALKRASFFIDNEVCDENCIKLSFDANLEDGMKNISDEAQKQLLLVALKKNDFNIAKSAKMLGISRENCYYFIRKFGIEREDA